MKSLPFSGEPESPSDSLIEIFGNHVSPEDLTARLEASDFAISPERRATILELAALYPCETITTVYPPRPEDTTDSRESRLSIFRYYPYGPLGMRGTQAEIGFDRSGKNKEDTLTLVLESLQNYFILCELGVLPKPTHLTAPTHKAVARMSKVLGFTAKIDEPPYYRVDAEYQTVREKLFSPKVLKMQARLVRLAQRQD